MTEIGIIGAGKLARNLIQSLKGGSWKVVQVISRSPERAESFAQEFSISDFGTDLSKIQPTLDLIFIATQDLAIAEVADQLSKFAGSKTIVVHGSGSVPLAALDSFGSRAGVIYPLQTFTSAQPADWKNIPIFIESRKDSSKLIGEFAGFLSSKVKDLDSYGRAKLHLAAVFACNFPNLMWILASEILKENTDLELEVYEPLVRQNMENVFRIGASESLTGPARRHDLETIKGHLALLENHPDMKEIYELLSKVILNLNL